MDYLKAFLVGGLICVVGQILIDKTNLTPARILTGFVVAGVVLTAVGLYEPLVNFAGAGATVPIIGFGNSLAQGAVNGAKTDGLFGALGGGLMATAVGISLSIGLSYLVALLTSSKTKKQ